MNDFFLFIDNMICMAKKVALLNWVASMLKTLAPLAGSLVLWLARPESQFRRKFLKRSSLLRCTSEKATRTFPDSKFRKLKPCCGAKLFPAQ